MASYEEFAAFRDCLKVTTGTALCQEDGVTFEELYGAAMARLTAKTEGKG